MKKVNIEYIKKLQDIIWQIEKCGASEDLTKAVIMCGELIENIKNE